MTRCRERESAWVSDGLKWMESIGMSTDVVLLLFAQCCLPLFIRKLPIFCFVLFRIFFLKLHFLKDLSCAQLLYYFLGLFVSSPHCCLAFFLFSLFKKKGESIVFIWITPFRCLTPASWMTQPVCRCICFGFFFSLPCSWHATVDVTCSGLVDNKVKKKRRNCSVLSQRSICMAVI